MTTSTNRRHFLATSSAAFAAATTVSRSRLSAQELPNSNLRVALIGCGNRGIHDAELFKNTPGVELTHLCDVDSTRRQAAAQQLGLASSRVLPDLRYVLDDKTIDAVIIATPDHWHSPAAILACDAGKHVYVEKPISHNIREGRLLVEAAERNKSLVQHGTQCRSTQMMIDAMRLLREGLIGNVLVAKCWNIQRRNPLPPGEDAPPPAELNYDAWIGPAPMIPYRTNRVHNRWTMWYHFGAGDMGNDGVHDLDYARWGLGVETHPNKISALGGKFFFNDDTEFPDTQQVTFQYDLPPNAPPVSAAGNGGPNQSALPPKKRLLIYEQRLWSTNHPHNCDSGAEFYGDQGEMFLSRRGKIEVRNAEKAVVPLEVTPVRQDAAAHIANFCAAIRGEAKLNADALTGHLSTSLAHLGNISTRLGRSLNFDPKTEQIIDDKEANALTRREYRDHWARPRDSA